LAKTKQIPSARSSAARVINEVLQNRRSLNAVLTPALLQLPATERSLCQNLSYGVLRWHPQLLTIANELLRKPLKKKDGDILALILCGFYQLRKMRIPAHAALSETVNASKILGKQWASGLINATLRNYQRNENSLDAKINKQLQSQFAHPDWLIKQIKSDWPDKWQAILDANNQQPPMMLRVNRLHSDRDKYLQRLSTVDIDANKLEHCPDGILLEHPCDVYKLPGFSDGDVSVQDGAAQQVVSLMDILPNQRILDACAAPGGKSCHILEQQSDNQLVALDIAPRRLEQVDENIKRLGLTAQLIAADACDTENWWDGQLFDRILVDAPCSGTGVIRRHPDIKHLRRPDDIASLAAHQHQILDALWPLLKADGLLIYTTCSALKEENEQQVLNFLKRHADAREKRTPNPPATEQAAGYQRLPGDDMKDGFYYACLQHV